MKFQFNYAFDGRMLDALGYEPIGQTILVIRLVMTAITLAEKNKVVFVTDDIEAKILFEHTVIGNGEFGNDDECIFIEGINKEGQVNWLNWAKENEMKFDVAVMNPPYDRNLHLKILEKVIPVADKVVNISPVRWLQDPFAPYSTRSDYRKFEETVSKKIESLDIVPAKYASEIFDASFTMNLGIYVCSEHGGYNYHHDDPLITKIVEKINESNWSICAYSKKYRTALKPYQLIVSGIHSASANYSLVCNTYEAQLNAPAPNLSSHNANNTTLFDFDTEEERHNFYLCYTHPFIEYLCFWWRVDVNINSVKVPYFGDFTHPWDYADFFAWFNLTEEEQERVKQEIAEMRAE